MVFFNSSSQFMFIVLLAYLLSCLAPKAAAHHQPEKNERVINIPSDYYIIHKDNLARPSHIPIINFPTNSYIVHTDNLTRPSHFPTQAHWYSSIVKSSIIAANTSILTEPYERIFYTYDTVMHGFAATLTPEEAQRLSHIPGVIGVYSDSVIKLHTTRSPDFLGLILGSNIWPESKYGENVTIGLVDSGVWPESPAFDDNGLGPIPEEWRGECVPAPDFNSSMCNKKLIGARVFDSGLKARGQGFINGSGPPSPRDYDGHGTHTASTAAGSVVANANLFGFANGTARGMATRARVAMYKACQQDSCAVSDVTAAIEAAIEDGVHILSLSLGASPAPFDTDVIAIGAFAAVRKGIFVACSAGNNGWEESSVTNVAPWIMTVGAGSIDRKFPARVTLGSGEVYIGESLYAGTLKHTRMTSLVYLADCTAVTKSIKGKILVCNNGFIDEVVAAAGGVGVIGLNSQISGEGMLVQAFTSPGLTLGYIEGNKLLSYMNSTSNPRARLEFNYQTVIGENRAPTVAFFSSRGPNIILPEILKPDILAPGMNIIASWPTRKPVTDNPKDLRRSGFNIISGTSMSCPHVAGIAALLRGAHPRWSPAMIQSAMMTTAFSLDNSQRPMILDENLEPATILATGAGYVDPLRARDPGLAYDLGIQDYFNLLCTMNYTENQLNKFMPGLALCSKFENGAADLNYPSFVVLFDNQTDVKILTRTLTKVSEPPETYEARVVNPRPDKLEVTIEPKKLEFEGEGEKLAYKMQFRSKVTYDKDEIEYGYVIWENSEHQVKSPVVFMWKNKIQGGCTGTNNQLLVFSISMVLMILL